MPGFTDFLSRIQTDHAFYLQFRQNPQETLSSYELSSEERAALIGPDAELWNHLRGKLFTLTTSHNIVALGSSDPEFNSDAVLGRPEVGQAITQIRAAGLPTERAAAVLDLMEKIA